MAANTGTTPPHVENVITVTGVATTRGTVQKKDGTLIQEGDTTVAEGIEVVRKATIIEGGIPAQEVLDREVIEKEVIEDIEDTEVKVEVVEGVEIVAFLEEVKIVKEVEI